MSIDDTLPAIPADGSSGPCGPSVPGAAPETAREQEDLLGRLLVEQGILTAVQLEECRAAQAAGGFPRPRLRDVFAARGYLVRPAVAATGAAPDPTLPQGAAPGAGTAGEAGRTAAAAPMPAEVEPALDRAGNDLGAYVLLEELGRGGMGTVHKAWDKELCRYVALKWIARAEGGASGLTPSSGDQERFLREARTAARLAHPNIVRVYGAGAISGTPYIATELVAGTTFRALLDTPERSGTTSGPRASRTDRALRQRIALLRDVARALDYAHGCGIVHRDVKPDNLLLARAQDRAGGDTGGWMAKVADFGLARDLQASTDLTRTGEAIGTPSYMSPEQADGRVHAIGPASDVFSLGCVLYETCTGVRPFEGASTAAVLYAVIELDPVRPRARVPALSRDLETIVLRCLEKNPARRYASAAALADDLASWLAGEPIQARPVPSAVRILRKLGKNRLAAAALAALVLVTALGAGGLAEQGRRRAREREQLAAEAEAARVRGDWPIAARALERLLAAAGPDPVLAARLDEARTGARAAAERGNQERAALARRTQADERRTRATPLFSRAFLEPRGLAGDQRAMEELTRAIEIDPDFGEAYAERGRRAMGWGRTREALGDFLKARALAPGYFLAAYYAGVVYMDWLHDTARAQEQFRALEGMKIAPDYALAARARLAMAEHRADDALRACDEVERLEEHLEDVYFIRGFVLSECRRPPDLAGAAAAFTRVIEQNPHSFLAFNNRALVKQKAGDLDGALADYNEALRLNPGFVHAICSRGSVRSQRGDGAGALADYTEAISQNPKCVEALVGRAVEHAHSEDFAGAEADFTESLRLEPDDAAVLTDRGSVRCRMEKYDAASADFDAALRLDPRQINALYGRSNVRTLKFEYASALEDLDAALAQKPDWAEALVSRARILTALLRLEEAIRDAEKVIAARPASDPVTQEARTALGVARQMQRQFGGKK